MNMFKESEQVRELRVRYRSSLGDKAQVIKEYSFKLNEEGVSDELMSDLHQALHKLAGSTGMYGFDKISSLCRKAMELVQQKDIELLQKKLKKIKKQLRKASELDSELS